MALLATTARSALLMTSVRAGFVWARFAIARRLPILATLQFVMSKWMFAKNCQRQMEQHVLMGFSVMATRPVKMVLAKRAPRRFAMTIIRARMMSVVRFRTNAFSTRKIYPDWNRGLFSVRVPMGRIMTATEKLIMPTPIAGSASMTLIATVRPVFAKKMFAIPQLTNARQLIWPELPATTASGAQSAIIALMVIAKAGDSETATRAPAMNQRTLATEMAMARDALMERARDFWTERHSRILPAVQAPGQIRD
jgi:hypothetical protein